MANSGRWYQLPILGSGLMWCVDVLVVVIHVDCSVEGPCVGGMTVKLNVDGGSFMCERSLCITCTS
jgi:hypothetical protein